MPHPCPLPTPPPMLGSCAPQFRQDRPPTPDEFYADYSPPSPLYCGDKPHFGLASVGNDNIPKECYHHASLGDCAQKVERVEDSFQCPIRHPEPRHANLSQTLDDFSSLASSIDVGPSATALLLDLHEETFSTELDDASSFFTRGLVAFRHVQILFAPGEIVVTTRNGEPAAYVSRSSSLSLQPNGTRLVRLHCYCWAFDGVFYKDESTIEISWPSLDDSPVPIADLTAYPLKFDPTTQLEKLLRDRGGMYWSYRKPQAVTSTATLAKSDLGVCNSRFIIDSHTYNILNVEESKRRLRCSDDLDEDCMSSNEPPDDPFILLLPAKIWGLGLHDKIWRNLAVKDLRPVRWNKKAFRQLVLDPRKKEVVEATIKMHITHNMSTDVIEGKGNGLVVLLHGGPGTGKTLTAECISDLVEKPLYSVTCGDLGTDPETVESRLRSALHHGSLWKAVILLDRIDVFLEQQEKADFRHQGLASVFLRILESYDGILILTSSKMGKLDPALKSRLNLALYYPPLDYRARWEIWNNFISIFRRQEQDDSAPPVSVPNEEDGYKIQLAKGESIDVTELCEKIDILAKEELNGREIRNVITTARQLALFREKPLGYIHLDSTIRLAKDFEEDIREDENTPGCVSGSCAQYSGMRQERQRGCIRPRP